MTAWVDAPEVKAVADRIIARNHRHLLDARVEYLFRTPAAKGKGKTVWGKARLMTGLNAYLATTEVPDDETAEPFFVIEIAQPVWALMDPAQREALVDHELCHCVADEEGVLGLVGHDLEEFSGVVRRHGMWRDEVESLVKAATEYGQPELWDAETGEIE